MGANVQLHSMEIRENDAYGRLWNETRHIF